MSSLFTVTVVGMNMAYLASSRLKLFGFVAHLLSSSSEVMLVITAYEVDMILSRVDGQAIMNWYPVLQTRNGVNIGVYPACAVHKLEVWFYHKSELRGFKTLDQSHLVWCPILRWELYVLDLLEYGGQAEITCVGV
ncbi:hypothetical protein FIBSPDRAFT_902339 [Athelia psychrophila]|uniref:Uncharacterized protein n=1 Tax=Athelia psychrophila TaxID=1759441 RepID=A0A167XC88_9AGAM|nr:hypothetical protein FIBSPDRAFT_902339 [Fibularhizoctonia sp. CBS 109695]